MPADWGAIEDALVAAVARASGVQRVIWSDQGGPRPAFPYLTLRRSDADTVGAVDERRVRDNPAGTPGDPAATPPVIGTEILTETVAQTELDLRVQAFTKATRGDGAAQALLTRARNGLALDSVRDALRSAGVTIVERGSVQNLTELINSEFEGRAAFDLRLRVVDGAVEAGTFIEKFRINAVFS